MPIDVSLTLERLKFFESETTVWKTTWQLVSDFVMQDGANFTSQKQPGELLNEDIFDSTANRAQTILSSALGGLLWANGAKSITFRVVHEQLKNDSAALEYFAKARNIVVNEMDEPSAGLAIQHDMYLNSSSGYGTSGILATRGTNAFFRFKAVDVQSCYIDENNEGRVDTLYMVCEKTVRQMVQEFGLENLSKKTQECYNANKFDEKVKLLYVIEPRRSRDKTKKDNKNMPFVSAYFEPDQKHTILESGFEEFPGGVSRFYQNQKEKYGRSPAIKCLPDVFEINTVRESRTIAREKQLDPPLVIYDDGRLGGGVINTSAGALNVLNVAGRSNAQNNNVQQMFTVGDLRVATEEIEELKEVITQHFSIDRLLDLNNETEMTLGEAQIRDRKNSLAMGGFLARHIIEMYTPLVERCFNMLFRAGKLGVINGSPQHMAAQQSGVDSLVIPDSVAKYMGSQEKVFEVIYNTPAARLLKAESVAGIIQTWQVAQQLGQTNPEVLDNLDADKSIKIIGAVNGAEEIFRPVKGKKNEPGVQDIRDQRSAAIKQQQEAQKAEQMATVAKMVPQPNQK